ncbi:NACHT domain-containing protein [Streptomyces sp. NBC_01205]|uniref:NACHT domain-containing protein n=1 Tax=Streptomyces sp. NBC_01205 TaxID=2903771 RepID=UPI002E1639E0|nr:NACHT domain-containing protein [Streptomyces sp. NBC_01205]
MTGIETVLLKVAGTAAGALVKSLLGRAPGAGLASDPVHPAARWQRPEELGGPEVRRLAHVLAARLGEATGRLPEHERLAVVDAVGDAFAALGTLDAEALFAADLDPAALAAMLAPPRGAALSEAAESVYRDLVALCCAHAVEYTTTLPGFGARAEVELIRRTGELTRVVERMGRREDGAAHAFEERYARYVADTHGRLQLFGLTFSQARAEWPLDLAYISLAVSGEQLLEEPGRHSAMKTELALSASERVLLRGPAGSGKSTLVQWLALNAARRSFKAGLHHWNTLVPFVLRLRSFNSPEGLPMPQDWLRASGVPLRAPDGWVENLLSQGRALVLVDGVDEVPSKFRSRTEEWLRSLLAAYPRARYVVTTRPSAVPEDWLTAQGFSLLSLLPMERADVSAFITHWHDSARAECGSEEERDSLERYEKSLIQSVGSRRDLGWLASNPLMCALLCALNRDRHMHLPRARKELYDAALDMLLVRRDTERDISGVEGVYLSRDEQTLLLQRLAYWLIRNGQVEASCTEAQEMVGEWLAAMPQVRAQAGVEQVFRHLLIRSGLLREPVPGSVHFVHRTFQDYLGAKAAVEARDFGVLVGNAHEDAWEDVVRMAVGHARPDERARLLRQLLRRADKVKRDQSRLVLLAAACLEHAPELDPAVWHEVEARTAHLLPPHSVGQAEELAKAGELVLELLPGPAGLDEQQAAAVIRTAALVGGERALQVIAGFRRDDRYDVVHELSDSWGRFPNDAYADAVLADAPVRVGHLHVRTPEQLSVLGRMPHVQRVHLTWNGAIPTDISGRRDLEWLVIHRNPALTDLAPLAGHPKLRHLGVLDCPEVTGIEAVAELAAADSLAFGYLREGLSLAPLAAVEGLKSLVIGFEPEQRWIGDVPAAEGLTSLALWQGVRRMTLDGIERWPGVKDLTIAGSLQYRQLVRSLPLPGLGSLQIRHAASVSAAALVPYRHLTELVLIRCAFEGTLEPLTELPGLRLLVLRECLGTLDLSPFADTDGLVIEVDRRTSVVGAERLPPGRLVFRH